MNRSERKIVLITGARSGIGRACADALVAQGHQVHGTSRTPPSETPGFRILPMDVNDADSVEAGVQSVIEETGRLDVVVNNAGFGYGGSVEDTSVAEAKALFETNFFGPMRVCQAVLPTMRGQGSGLIVNVSSIRWSDGAALSGAVQRQQVRSGRLYRFAAYGGVAFWRQCRAAGAGRHSYTLYRQSTTDRSVTDQSGLPGRLCDGFE